MKTGYKNSLVIGCVADDFTGASDIASFFSLGGLNVILVNGILRDDFKPGKDVQCIVIALKTRTDEPEIAVRKSLDAFKGLKSLGCGQLFFKYCSTFNSTKTGNIGPVIDALLETFDIKYTVVSPGLPVNGREVKKGLLYVDGVPLNKSPMKDHPLTPMWSASIPELMRSQGKYKSYVFTDRMINKDRNSIKGIINNIDKRVRDHFYLIPDHYNENHAGRLIDLFGDLPLLTGSSGLAYELARKYGTTTVKHGKRVQGTKDGKGIILSGSCSVTTVGQINDYIKKGGYAVKIVPEKLLKGEQRLEDLWEHISSNGDEDVLVYSFDGDIDRVKARINHDRVSVLIEDTFAKIGQRAVEKGYSRIIIAGGETSGAVLKGLGYNVFSIGETVSPGIPILIPEHRDDVGLVLKSGNFGEKDFFNRAMERMKISY